MEERSQWQVNPKYKLPLEEFNRRVYEENKEEIDRLRNQAIRQQEAAERAVKQRPRPSQIDKPAPYFLEEILALSRASWLGYRALHDLHRQKQDHGWIWIESQA